MARCARLAFLALCGTLSCFGTAAADELSTDANIITGLDVSSSINAQETKIQIDGMAQAIRSPAIISAIQHGRHGRIGFSVFVWADGEYPELVSWRMISSPEDAEATSQEIASRLQTILESASRSVGTLTNLSGAIDHASQMLQQAPFATNRAIVNIIGNGEDNVGEDPQRARAELIARGVTINGVVVGGDPVVLNYYRHQVIGGRTAFVLSADKAETLVQVFALKFVSEIALHIQPGLRPDRL
jgi:Ca-activated chloride channel homolog